MRGLGERCFNNVLVSFCKDCEGASGLFFGQQLSQHALRVPGQHAGPYMDF